MKTTQQIYDQHQRMFRRAMRLGKAAAKRRDPATDGNELLVHNWGNAESNDAWRHAWVRWNRVDPIYRAMYDEAEHRAHVGKFVPLWCKHCQGTA